MIFLLKNIISAPKVKNIFLFTFSGAGVTQNKYKYKCIIYNTLNLAKEMKLIHYFYLCCWCLCCYFTLLYSLNEDRNRKKNYIKICERISFLVYNV